MSQVFIIGLPKLIRSRVESALRAGGHFVRSVQAGRQERSGIFVLLPDASHAVGKLREYYDSLESYDLAKVYVLPFANIPDELDQELDELDGLGGEIVEFEMGEDGCPTIEQVNPTLDQAFQDAVVKLLKDEILGDQHDVLPSNYIRQAVAESPGLIIIGDAIELCDAVSRGRYPWIVDAINAFVELIHAKGEVGEHESFFAQRNLLHAQTGGITVDLDVFNGETRVRQLQSQTHLKKGDNTTRQAAARIYYQVLAHSQAFYVFILYVGPHPERDLARTYHFP